MTKNTNYIRFLTPSIQPYDPIELAKRTEEIVGDGDKRKYTAFYATGVYGGIATGYTVGCCLRCCYCWVDWSRDYPEKFGKYYSAEETFRNLLRTAQTFKVKKMRISGGEPTLCREHLLGVLEKFERSEFPLFILETNGILFGNDENYVADLTSYTKIHVRVSLKAALPKGFVVRTGAKGEFVELPFRAIKYLKKYNISFHVAAMTDPHIMAAEERLIMIEKLAEIDPRIAARLEEEKIDPYDTTIERLRLATGKKSATEGHNATG